MDWKEQYRHPNWQRKRLEALEEADYVCRRCGGGDDTLHVHHRRYIKGRKVWEYAVRELEVLCESCHEITHSELELLKGLIAQIPSDALNEVIGLLTGFCSTAIGPIREVSTEHALSVVGEDDPMVQLGKVAGDIQRSNGRLILQVKELVDSYVPQKLTKEEIQELRENF